MIGYKGDIGWKAEGFLNPATTNLQMGTYWIGRDASGITFDASNNLVITNALDMNGKNIHMGAGLIGYDGTASEGLSFDTNGNVTLEATAGSLVLPINNDAVTPTLAFGDGNTGLYESADNTLVIAIGGAASFRFNGDNYEGLTSGAARLVNAAASSTVAAITFNGDSNTGLGRAAADQLSLIAGGVEGMRITEATTITINAYGNVYPGTDDTYYLGKNDDDTPFAWKGLIVKDTTDGKYYRIESISGTVTATDLSD